MPKPAKALDAQSKHLTKAERQARERAEAEIVADRRLGLKPPSYVKVDTKAKRYWAEIVARMADLSILDALDCEVLAVYCTMLSRRDATHQLFSALLKEAKE